MSNASLRADVPALDELLEAQCPNVRVDLVSHVVIANTPNYAPATTTDKITTMMPMADSFPLSSSSNRCSVTKSSKPTAVPLTTSPVNTSVSTTSPTIVKFVNNTAEELESKMSSGEDGPKRKRARTSPEQLRILQKAFAVDPMPTAASRLTLAAQLGMTPRAVQVWFQNRRAKGKLDGRKEEDGAPVGSSASCSDASPSMPSNTYFAAYRHTLDALQASGTFTSPSSMYAPYYSAYYAASVYDYYKSLSYPPYAAMNLNGVATSASANTASIGHPSSMDNTSAPKLPRPVATSNVSCLTTAVEQNPTTLSLPAGTAPLLSSASSMKNTVVNSFSQPAQLSADMSVSDDSKKGSGTGFYIAPEKCTLSEMLLPRSDLPLSASVSCPAISQHASTVKDSRYQLFGTPLHDATTHRASIDMSSRNFSMSSSEGANTLPFSKSCPDQDLIVAALRASSMTDSAMNVANTSTFDHSLMQPTFELMRKSLENTPSPSPPPASMQICMPMPISYYSEEKMMRSLPETPPASGNIGIAGSFSSTSMDSFTGKAQNRHSSLALAFPQAGKKSGLLNEKNMSSLTYTRSEMNVDCDAKAALCWDRKGKSMKEPYSLYTNWDSNTPPPMMTDMSYRGKGEKQMSPAPETSAFSWYHQGQDLAGKESFYGYPDFEEMAAAQGKKMAGVFDAHGQSGSTDE